MARIRTVKPEFFTSEDICGLSPLARLLYIATWCEADKEGRLAWKPGTFKLRYLPADNCDIEALCGELVKAGLVVLYGDGLAYIPRFSSHQHINPRESDSTLPEPPAKARVPTRADASRRVNSEIDRQGGREGKGKERKGKEGEDAPEAREVVIPDLLTLTDLVAEGVEQQHGNAWLLVRREKGAKTLSRVAWNAVKREAALAGISPAAAVQMCAESGWQGFKASWVQGARASPSMTNKQEALEAANRTVANRWIGSEA